MRLVDKPTFLTLLKKADLVYVAVKLSDQEGTHVRVTKTAVQNLPAPIAVTTLLGTLYIGQQD